MNDSDFFAAPPTDHLPVPVLRSRRQSRRSWRHRLLLAVPRLSFILVLGALALGAGLEFSGGHHSSTVSNGQASATASSAVTVYTVDQVRVGLQTDATTWIGHQILVHGILQGPFVFCAGTNPCPAPTLGLLDDGNAVLASTDYLPVLPGSIDSAALPFNVPTTFEMNIQAAPDACARNADILCYQGVLGDAGTAN